MANPTYKIQHLLVGEAGEECEVYTELTAESEADAREKFLTEQVNRVEYWDVKISEIIQKKYE